MGWTRRAALAAGFGAPLWSPSAWGQGGSDRVELVIGKTGHIFARTKVNGKDVHALLDNDQPTVINIQSSLLSAGDRAAIEFGSRDFAPLRVPATYRFDQAVVAIDVAIRGMGTYSEVNGFTVDLVLGKSVFAQNVVELDFRRKTMWFHRASGFKTPNDAVAFGGDGNKGLLLPVKLGDDVAGLARVMTGFSGYVSVSDPKVFDWLQDGRKVDEREATRIYGSVAVKAMEQTFLSPPLTVGNWQFGPVMAWVDTVQEPGLVGTLGVAALRPFKVWLDESHGRIWMRPQARFSRASISPGSQSR